MLTFCHFLSYIASGGNWTRILDHVIMWLVFTTFLLLPAILVVKELIIIQKLVEMS
jgi:hypothetical protein